MHDDQKELNTQNCKITFSQDSKALKNWLEEKIKLLIKNQTGDDVEVRVLTSEEGNA